MERLRIIAMLSTFFRGRQAFRFGGAREVIALAIVLLSRKGE
jgi:hypothetical protein